MDKKNDGESVPIEFTAVHSPSRISATRHC